MSLRLSRRLRGTLDSAVQHTRQISVGPSANRLSAPATQARYVSSKATTSSVISSKVTSPTASNGSSTTYRPNTLRRGALNTLIVFGSATLGFILCSTLYTYDLPLLPNLTSKIFAESPLDSPEARGQGTKRPLHGSKRAYDAAIKNLQSTFGGMGREGDVSVNEDDLKAHGMSEWSHHAGHNPSVVVWARSTEDISEVVKVANKFRVPITVYSGGTSLEGHTSSPYGGISLDVSNMNKILRFSEPDGDINVQCGVRWEQINEYLDKQGVPLFWPIDPGPGATIGGMCGTGCSGTNAVRYGTMKGEWVLNLTVVLPDGEIIQTRQRARKSSAGYDLAKLFIGAEGTLGIVTEATLKLAPKLPTKVATVTFENGVEAAVDAATEVVTAGLPVQCVEFLDALTMHAINEGGLTSTKYPEKDTLFFKLQGSDNSMKEISATLETITTRHGGRNFAFAKTKEDADSLWEGRKAALWSVMALEEGSRVWTTDVCVPISKIARMIQETTEDFKQRGITACHFGHVGDGNVHSLALFKNAEELAIVKAGVHDMVIRAIELEGTCTGEHGVGIGKIEYLEQELGAGTLELMQTIKRAVDPHDIMNPGKLYPGIKPEQKA